MGFSTDGRKWPSSQCKLKLNGPAWDASWKQTAADAMDEWNNAAVRSGANFKFTPDNTTQDHFAAYDLTQWNGWIAMTYTHPTTQNSSLSSVEILLNLYYEWDVPMVVSPEPISPRSIWFQAVSQFSAVQ